MYIHLYKKDWNTKISSLISNKDIADAYLEIKSFNNMAKDEAEKMKTIQEFLKGSQKQKKELNDVFNNFFKQVDDFLYNLGKEKLFDGKNGNLASLAHAETGSLNHTADECIEALSNIEKQLRLIEDLDKTFSNLLNKKQSIFTIEGMERFSNVYDSIKNDIEHPAEKLADLNEQVRVNAVRLNSIIRGDLNEIAKSISYEMYNKVCKGIIEVGNGNNNKKIKLKLTKTENVGGKTDIKTKKISKADNLIYFDYEVSANNYVNVQIGVSEKAYSGKTLVKGKERKAVSKGNSWDSVMENGKVKEEVVEWYSNAIVHNGNTKPNSLANRYILAKNIMLFLSGSEDSRADFINLNGEIHYLPELVSKHQQKLLTLEHSNVSINNKAVDKKNLTNSEDAKIRSANVYRQVQKTNFVARWKMNL